AIDDINTKGTKDEKIFALNLDYMAKNMDPKEEERILTSSPHAHRSISPTDFVNAKAHLLSDETLRRALLDPRLQFVGYGKGGEREELKGGEAVRIGPSG